MINDGPGEVPPTCSVGTLTGLCQTLQGLLCGMESMTTDSTIILPNSNKLKDPTTSLLHVLIIDDNQILRRLLKRTLQLYCSDKIATIVDVSCPVAGLHHLASREVDMIFMDIDMPILTGIETTEIIRGRRDYPIRILSSNIDIPIVAVTTNDTMEDRRRYFDAGMNDFLAKPFTRHQILDLFNIYQDSTSTICLSPNSPEMTLKSSSSTSNPPSLPIWSTTVPIPKFVHNS